MLRIATSMIYQNVALESADWSSLAGRATLAVFNDHLFDVNEIVERLAPFDVVCLMRERTPLTRGILERLPQLKLILSTGPQMHRSMSRRQQNAVSKSGTPTTTSVRP
jgi:hypothetical protein